jgi:activator of HSP90 ATPase
MNAQELVLKWANRHWTTENTVQIIFKKADFESLAKFEVKADEAGYEEV